MEEKNIKETENNKKKRITGKAGGTADRSDVPEG